MSWTFIWYLVSNKETLFPLFRHTSKRHIFRCVFMRNSLGPQWNGPKKNCSALYQAVPFTIPKKLFKTNVVHQLNPLSIAPKNTIMWLKHLLEMNYTEFPTQEPSSCELSKCKHVLTCPTTQVSSRVWRTSSRVCILYRELCFCVLYWAVVCDVCGFEKADDESKKQLTNPQWEPRGGSAKGRFHWTPFSATWEAYQWRPDGIGGPEKG